MHGVRLASLIAATVILIPSSLFVASSASAQMRCTRAAAMPVSYTHLTLPTNREV